MNRHDLIRTVQFNPPISNLVTMAVHWRLYTLNQSSEAKPLLSCVHLYQFGIFEVLTIQTIFHFPWRFEKAGLHCTNFWNEDFIGKDVEQIVLWFLEHKQLRTYVCQKTFENSSYFDSMQIFLLLHWRRAQHAAVYWTYVYNHLVRVNDWFS